MAGAGLSGCAAPTPAGGGPFSATDLARAAALRDAALHSPLAWELLQSLVTEVGPRAAGSPGDAKAVAWAQSRMRQLGLAQVRAQLPALAHRRL